MAPPEVGVALEGEVSHEVLDGADGAADEEVHDDGRHRRIDEEDGEDDQLPELPADLNTKRAWQRCERKR